MIVVIIIIAIILSLFFFDKFQASQNIRKAGGIRVKYKTLISWIASAPSCIVEEHKDHVLIKVNTPTIRTVFEIIPAINTLIVTVNMDYGSIGKINNTWKFNESKYTQQGMINTIRAYMSSAQDRLHSSIQNKSPINDLEYFTELSKQIASNKSDGNVMSEGLGKFGLEITNPIPVAGVIGSIKYLDLLRTVNNDKISYKRYGSSSASNINGSIDIYEIYKEERKIANLYISIYNQENSTLAPEGFKLFGVNNKSNNTNTYNNSKIDDYLLKSGVKGIEEALKEDNLELIKNLISQPNIDKVFLKDFILKYNISLYKFQLNKEFYSNPYLHINPLSRTESKLIAPSLIRLAIESKLNIMNYPKWYYYGFPDVILWATKEGFPEVKYIFSQYTNDLLEDQVYLNKAITRCIDKYLEINGYLECGKNFL